MFSISRVVRQESVGKTLTNLYKMGYDLIKPLYYLNETAENDLNILKDTYGNLPADPAPGNRKRAYTRFLWCADTNALIKDLDSSYSQSPEYNYVDGGKIRKFEQISNTFLESSLTQKLIAKNIEIAKGFKAISFDKTLEVGLHQIRYEPSTTSASYSSPTWLHRDDEPLVFVHLFNVSSDLEGGDNVIAEGPNIINGVFKLRQPLETLVLSKKILHAVTPMGTGPTGKEARDILLVTFNNRKEPKAEEKEKSGLTLVKK